MSAPLRIAIAGAAGRMGQTLIKLAGPQFIVVGGTERAGASQIGQDLGMLAALEALGALAVEGAAEAAKQADVWIDFTAPAATLSALGALKGTTVKAAIVGTTGLSAEQEAEVASHAKRIAVVRDRNFSLGVNLLFGLVEQAAARLGSDWDIEIFEAHHRRKVDAPSGTALAIGEAAARGRKVKLADVRAKPYDGITGPREAGRIGFAVSRAGGIIGDHCASFTSDEEQLALSHRALDRAVFARGALAAAKWAAGKGPGLYTMRDVLAL